MSKRKKYDQYMTPAFMVNSLVSLQRIDGTVFECCSGDHSITNIVGPMVDRVVTNDIDKSCTADYHLDAAQPAAWDIMCLGSGRPDWVVTNPPFSQPACLNIVQQAYNHAEKGIIMLLRLSFKEPTGKRKNQPKRGQWLASHPITREFVLPRHSFTGDGKSDNVTVAWMVWLKPEYAEEYGEGPAMLSLYQAEKVYAEAQPLVAPQLKQFSNVREAINLFRGIFKS